LTFFKSSGERRINVVVVFVRIDFVYHFVYHFSLFVKGNSGGGYRIDKAQLLA
jgi:hypothetical protein